MVRSRAWLYQLIVHGAPFKQDGEVFSSWSRILKEYTNVQSKGVTALTLFVLCVALAAPSARLVASGTRQQCGGGQRTIASDTRNTSSPSKIGHSRDGTRKPP